MNYTYTIYGQNENETIYSIATISTEIKQDGQNIIDMLFDYQEWANYGIHFETIWVEEKGGE